MITPTLGLILLIQVDIITAQIIEDPTFQRYLDRQFASEGVDSFVAVSARAKHTAFVGRGNGRARALAEAYQFRKFVLVGSRTGNATSSGRQASRVRKGEWPGACARKTYNCDKKSRFRSVDGSCNNLDNPTWGQSFIQMRRFLPPQYDNGKNSPRVTGVDGSKLPSARLVSTTVHPSGEEAPKLRGITHMVMQWGQFLDHDITLSPVQTGEGGLPLTCCPDDVPPKLRLRLRTEDRHGCFPIEIPPGDRHFNTSCMTFPRSIQVSNNDCNLFPAEQLNTLTAYVDASMVYGSEKETEEKIRTFKHGLLKSKDDLLPFDKETVEVCSDKCFKAGDERVNEQMSLASIQTVFMREHNRMTRALHQINPHWKDERLYQEARKILGGIVQKITYNDFLPIVLGRRALNKYRLRQRRYGFNNVYDDKIDPSIRNSFAAAAYRFGHSLIRSVFTRLSQSYYPKGFEKLRDLFGNTKLITSSPSYISELLGGTLVDKPNRVDRFFTREVTDFLFMTGNSSIDLVAFNIQRGRDHGVPSYTHFRELCGLSKVTRFGAGYGGLVDHTDSAAQQLEKAYKSPEDIDLFSGGVSELPFDGGLVGPTFTCLIGRQFSLLKRGDRFWYETDDPNTGFTRDQLEEIRRSSLSRILCDNTRIFYLQPDAFRTKWQVIQNCYALPQLNLEMWRERVRNHWSKWSSWSQCRYGDRYRHRRRSCLPSGAKCRGPKYERSICEYFDYISKHQ